MIMDYYNRTTSDLLTDVNLPEYTGFPSFKTNLVLSVTVALNWKPR